MIEILRMRRSSRVFLNKPISSMHFDIIKESLLRAPTSKNNRPCEFIFVDSKNLLKKLSEAKSHGASFLKDSPLGVVIIADSNKSDVWVEDASIAAITMQYVCESLGMGSCWIQIRERFFSDEINSSKYVKELLDIPDNFEVLAIVAAGYPVKSKEPVLYETLLQDKIKTNSYK
ncbi:MAG: nitroreductase family protein [Deltaproteobacteria bacterium]|nr:nitroreductase family protein [Deltaproteobacteria bacterium]